jgi:hypothetical protein
VGEIELRATSFFSALKIHKPTYNQTIVKMPTPTIDLKPFKGLITT